RAVLVHRPRRLRRTAAIRNLIRETNLSRHDFVLPLFVSEKIERAKAIPSMPGVHQYSGKEIAAIAQRAHESGVQAVLLFGIPKSKDEQAGFDQTGIMSYAAKFASVFYGPFRDAAESPPQFGDRRSYQMDPANADEALREVELDLAEGADIVLVKPALPYLDILWRVRQRFGRPTAVYHVSGEFAMVKAAAEKGLVDERAAVLEIMTSLKRAGADFIVSYWALDLMEWLKS